MIVSIIVAMDESRLIGVGNRLPWRLPADLRHFKATTMGKPILMGRKTYESIGRPLPGRDNLVMTSDPEIELPGCTVVHSLEDAFQSAATQPELMVIGGSSVYAQVLPRSKRIYLTRVHHNFVGDAWFPEIDDGLWQETSRIEHQPDADNPWPYTFSVLQRTGTRP